MDMISTLVLSVLKEYGTVDDMKALGYSSEEIYAASLLSNEDSPLRKDTQTFLNYYVTHLKNEILSSIMPMFRFFLEECHISVPNYFVRNLLCAHVFVDSSFPDMALDSCSQILQFVLLFKNVLQSQEADIYCLIGTCYWNHFTNLCIPMLLDLGLRSPLESDFEVGREKDNFTKNCWNKDNWTQFLAIVKTRKNCNSAAWAWLNISRRRGAFFGDHFEYNLFPKIAKLIWNTRNNQDLWQF